MNNRTLNVELRTQFGKNESNRLRSKGFVPAVLYSHGTTESIMVPVKAFSSIFSGHISESILIDLNITNKSGDSKMKAFVKDYQVDPVTNEIKHLDLYKITENEKIRTIVSIEIQGTPIGVKEGGVLEIFERELEIECLPKDLPEQILIDASPIALNESFHISDIKLGESVKFLGSPDRVILSVIIPHIKEEEVPAAEAEVAEEGTEEKAEGEESKAKD